MYLHLGQDYIVPLQSVVAVFDMDTATASKRTARLIERLQDEGRIIELYEDLPRAGVLCENALGETLYLTSLSSQALQRRAEKAYAI
ncbi:extracellular matrix/biofilm biosynthesis regulator RemA family protein [uncultured Agathobaculum sp.]|uniref:extracellular matrix regulator RemB n=1 Tax=uncultured Agathobaculum sp. TaxID=2048140 RepID=UPI00262CD0E8|nr:extracellular matrix/biofilm biosynthesis regulator RemA family protein [uncultured Agathobaculum sp.]